MGIAKIFNNGRSQAVRLPKHYRFDADEVFITKTDGMAILYPLAKGWQLLSKGIEHFTTDYYGPS